MVQTNVDMLGLPVCTAITGKAKGSLCIVCLLQCINVVGARHGGWPTWGSAGLRLEGSMGVVRAIASCSEGQMLSTIAMV